MSLVLLGFTCHDRLNFLLHPLELSSSLAVAGTSRCSRNKYSCSLANLMYHTCHVCKKLPFDTVLSEGRNQGPRPQSVHQIHGFLGAAPCDPGFIVKACGRKGTTSVASWDMERRMLSSNFSQVSMGTQHL